jgi:hypothetical protein
MAETDTGYEQDFDQSQALGQRRQELSGAEESWGAYFHRRSVPHASALARQMEERQYGEAMGRYNEGRANRDDVMSIAQYERLEEIDRNRTLMQRIGSSLAGIPAMVGEVMMGGAAARGAGAAIGAGSRLLGAGQTAARIGSAVASNAASTALAPSFYLHEATRRNVEQGRDAADVRGFPAPMAMAMIQNAILGTANSRWGGRMIPDNIQGRSRDILSRMVGVGLGLGEQHLAIEPLAEGISQILPEAYRLQTGHGVLTNAINGHWGEAWQQFAVSAATFAAFATIHGSPEKGKELLKSEGELMQQLARDSVPRDRVPEQVQRINNQVHSDPASVNEMPPGPARVYATNVRDTLQAAADANKPKQQEMLPHDQPGIDRLSAGLPVTSEPTMPEPVARTWGEHFPDSQQTVRDGRAVLQSNLGDGYSAWITHSPATPGKPEGVRIDFDTPKGDTASGRTTRMISKLISFVKGLNGTGTDVEFRAIGRTHEGGMMKGKSTDRSKTYIKALEKAGWEQVDKGAGGFYRFREKAAVKNGPNKLSPEAQSTYEKEYAKVKAEGLWKDHEAIHQIALERAQAVEREHRDAATDMSRVGQEEGATHGEVKAVAQAIDKATEIVKAAKAGENVNGKVKKAIKEELPGLSGLLKEGESLDDLVNILKGGVDGDARSTGSGSAESPSVHSAHERGLAEEASRSEALAETQERQELRGTEEGARPAGAGGETSADVGAAPSPEPGAGDQAGGYRTLEDAFRAMTPEKQREWMETAGRLQNYLAEQQAAQARAVRHQVYKESYAAEAMNGTKNNPTADFVRDLIRGEGGYLDLHDMLHGAATGAKNIMNGAVNLLKSIRDTVGSFKNEMSKAAGEIFPALHKLSEAAGQALTKAIAAKPTAARAAPMMLDRLLKDSFPNATQEQRVRIGATLDEVQNQARRFQAQQNIDKVQAEADGLAHVRAYQDKHKELLRQVAEMKKDMADMPTNIGKPDSPLVTFDDYQKSVADPKMRDVISKWETVVDGHLNKYWRDPDKPVAGMTILAKEKNVEGAGSTEGASEYRVPGEPKKRGDRTYDWDVGSMLEHTLGTHMERAARMDAYKELQNAGLATVARPESKEGWTEFKDADGQGKSMWVKNEAAGDFKDAFKKSNDPTTFRKINDMISRANLASTLEAAYHSKNLLTMLLKPGVFIESFKGLANRLTQDPAAMQRLVELSEMGVSTPSMRGSNKNPLNWLGNTLHALRDGIMLGADEAFTKLAKSGHFDIVDTDVNRRNFLNQMGQYNERGQAKMVQLARATGLGPFATAGWNYFMQGLRTMTFDPGIQTSSLKGQAMLRAWMFAKVATVAGVAMAVNHAMHGRVDGDENTPLGAIKVGTDASGKTRYVDIVNFTGLTRGLRETGLLALAEGNRQGHRPGQIIDRASRDILSSVVHPFEGPPVALAHMLATGEDTMGRRLTPRGGDSRFLSNLSAAAGNVNPMVASIGGFNRSPEQLPASGFERGMELLGPYGVKSREDVSRFNTVFRDLEARRNEVRQRPGERFEDEPQYRRMSRYEHMISEVNRRIRRERAGGSEERIAELRQRQNELARRALEQ